MYHKTGVDCIRVYADPTPHRKEENILCHVVGDKSKAWSQRSWLKISTCTWLHKLRCSMVRGGRDKLTGAIEVDETYVGGVGAEVRGRGAKRKTVFLSAAGMGEGNAFPFGDLRENPI